MINTKRQDLYSNPLESRFSKSTERIKAKNISFERFLKAQGS